MFELFFKRGYLNRERVKDASVKIKFWFKWLIAVQDVATISKFISFSLNLNFEYFFNNRDFNIIFLNVPKPQSKHDCRRSKSSNKA